jgi:hypothetical protein
MGRLTDLEAFLCHPALCGEHCEGQILWREALLEDGGHSDRQRGAELELVHAQPRALSLDQIRESAILLAVRAAVHFGNSPS